MKLISLKLNDGFRSLHSGFHVNFRSSWDLKSDNILNESFSPFICAGRNGSGKSNVLEAIAAIFYQMEVIRVRRNFLPDDFLYDEVSNPQGYKDNDASPNAFEIEYLIEIAEVQRQKSDEIFAHVTITKQNNQSPVMYCNGEEVSYIQRHFLLPDFVLAYSSGENEILSLPFFKMCFIQFDEYWSSLKKQMPYSGRPDTRMTYIDTNFSQAVMICNLLFESDELLKPFRQDLGIQTLTGFRIILKRSIELSKQEANSYGENHPAISYDDETQEYKLDVLSRIEVNDDSPDNFDPIVSRLKRCASSQYLDDATDTLFLDYIVNDETKKAFRNNFEESVVLFQTFQVLLTLNLYSVSDTLKSDLYKSNSHHVNETIPILASDERIMRFKFVTFTKDAVDKDVILKNLSDGEHQFLHSLGLCLLFKNTKSLFLLDEPETHFNPDWRSKFISRLQECLISSNKNYSNQEMLITTHSPFLISDCQKQKVLVFEKEDNKVGIKRPSFQTFGASINKITFEIFNKTETIGDVANALIIKLAERFKQGDDREEILKELNDKLGDSIEKILLTKTILDSNKEK